VRVHRFAPALAAALLGCGDPDLPVSDAVRPVLARLDRGGDGVVDEGDYQAVAYAAPPFVRVDADGDGRLSAAEITRLVLTQDPSRFDPSGRMGPDRWSGEAPAAGRPPAERDIEVLLSLLKEQVVAADPDVPVPTDEALHDAAAQGRIEAPEVQSALTLLAGAHRRAGLPFPVRLLLASPRAPPAAIRPPG